MISLIALIIFQIFSPTPAAAYVFSSTYQPQLYITIDGEPAGRNIVIRAHQRDEPTDTDDIFPCDNGRCYFSDNHHKVETNWQYYVERLDKKIPSDLQDKPKARTEFYRTEATAKYSQEITGTIQSFDFTARQQKNDYTVVIDTTANTATANTVYQGDYIPGEDGLEIGQFNISPDTIRIAIFVLVIIMIYISIKFFPLGHH